MSAHVTAGKQSHPIALATSLDPWAKELHMAVKTCSGQRLG